MVADFSDPVVEVLVFVQCVRVVQLNSVKIKVHCIS